MIIILFAEMIERITFAVTNVFALNYTGWAVTIISVVNFMQLILSAYVGPIYERQNFFSFLEMTDFLELARDNFSSCISHVCELCLYKNHVLYIYYFIFYIHCMFLLPTMIISSKHYDLLIQDYKKSY